VDLPRPERGGEDLCRDGRFQGAIWMLHQVYAQQGAVALVIGAAGDLDEAATAVFRAVAVALGRK